MSAGSSAGRCSPDLEAVDLERKCAWVHPDQSKTRKAIAVPLNVEAMAVLNERQGHHTEYVFAYEGQAVWQVNTKSWRNAVKAAGPRIFGGTIYATPGPRDTLKPVHRST